MTEETQGAAPKITKRRHHHDPWSRTRLKRYGKWLTAERVTAFATVVQAVILAIALYYTKVTLDEGNRISWRTFLDNRSADMNRKLIDIEALRCVYRYKIASVDSDCLDKVYDKKNVSQVIEYVSQILDNLGEVKEYSDEDDPDYYDTWYKGLTVALSEDPTGVVSFVLWDGGCTSDKDCDVARNLGICIADNNFHIDEEHCFDNLVARRKQFLTHMGETVD